MADEIGSTITATFPTVGVTPGPTWATDVNAVLLALKTAVEAGVRTAIGLTVDSNVDADGHAITALNSIALDDVVTALGTLGRVYRVTDDLWFTDGQGRQVRLTADGALNAASIAGILGDYGGSNPAAVTYVDALKTYVFTSDTGLAAKLDCGEIKLRETGTPGVNAISLKSPAGLPASLNMVFPNHLPSADGLSHAITIDDAGLMNHTNQPHFTNITTDGADIQHGARTVFYGASFMNTHNTSDWAVDTNSAVVNGMVWTMSTSGTSCLTCDLMLQPGSIITGVTIYMNQGTAASLVNARLYEGSLTANTTTTKSNNTAAPATSGYISFGLTGISSYTVLTATRPYVIIGGNGTNNGISRKVLGIEVTYSLEL